MSANDTETNNSEDDSTDFALERLKNIKNWKLEEVYAYIEQLHQLLERKNRKLIKYKQKYKKLLEKNVARRDSTSDVAAQASQAETANNGAAVESGVDNELTASTAFSFVDEMRQVAEQAQNLNDFVYEPTSGLYYDPKSGYYYNAEYGLYYDGNTGCYYSYNQEKKSYEFHSQVEVQATDGKNPAAANSSQDPYGDVEVEFDEWGGVITDPKKLQAIKDEKQKMKDERDKHKKKNKKEKDKEEKKLKRKLKKQQRKEKKQKMSKRHGKSDDEDSKQSSNGSDSDDEEQKQTRADVEDGELSSSCSTSSNGADSDAESDASEGKIKHFKVGSRFQDIAKKYPPSLRIVVQDTNLDQLQVGSLHIITYKGGSLGREGNHDVIVPDLNVSKFHLKFVYDHKQSTYKCTDLGSRNGTILNGKRMSSSKTESEAYELVHGSVLQLGLTKLLCHVHEGNSTCGQCEPGLLIEKSTKVTKGQNSDTVVLTHKEQLKKLQKKYGLENEKFVDGAKPQSSTGTYNDRAATRRVKVGSTTDKEKTQVASVDTEIPSENKGFKMLAKLGWNKGETLGKASAAGGLLEPINVTSNTGTKGLGCDDPSAGIRLTASDKRKLATLKKTQERYQKSADIFDISDDSD